MRKIVPIKEPTELTPLDPDALAACMARHPAGRDLPQWRRVTRAQNVQAMWTPSGLHIAYWDHGEVTTLLLDEAAQQALRNALGGAR